MSTDSRQNLFDLGRDAMATYFTALGEKPFRATQVMKWVYQHGVADFAAMTNLAKSLRQRLAEDAVIDVPEIIHANESGDGTRKWLLRLTDGNAIETVYIPEDDRGTLCISSQVGCSLNCSFCSTARQGYNRNLTAGEIIAQLWVASRELGSRTHENRVISNVVMMGMGEPLLNFDNVVTAMHLMLDDHAYGLSRRRITLSTAGVVPAILRLRRQCDVSLAVSLHAPRDELRDVLVPLNKKYPLRELLSACREYVHGHNRRRITFEYVMLDGVNDSVRDARELVKLLQSVPAKVNLIPWNPFPNAGYRSSPRFAIDRFRDILVRAGIVTVTRKTRGDDIDAACGQLAGQVQDRTRRSVRLIQDVRVNS